MTVEELKREVYELMLWHKPKHIRSGQFVFNYIEAKYKVARQVQFEDKVDCFYRDECIDEFIECSVKWINKK